MGSPFYVFKLRTGETLFGELVVENDYSYSVRLPMSVREVKLNDMQDGIKIIPWIPFTDDTIFDINSDLIYYMGELNETYIKFYGSVLLRDELTKVQESFKVRVGAGESSADVYAELLDKIKEIGVDYSIKFGLAPVEHHPVNLEDVEIRGKRVLH